jgi:hypothetical protein
VCIMLIMLHVRAVIASKPLCKKSQAAIKLFAVLLDISMSCVNSRTI